METLTSAQPAVKTQVETPVLTVAVEAVANVHSHLREGQVVGPLIQKNIQGGADVIAAMPNTSEGLTNAGETLEYLSLCKSLVPEGASMTFIPITMITEATTVDDILECARNNIWDFKIYPRYRTTKSEKGAVRYWRILRIVRKAGYIILQKTGKRIKIHFHPEHPSILFSNRDAEFAFLPVLYMFVEETEAIIISEHGTDGRCIPHWKRLAGSGHFYVTLTAHHLLTTEDLTFGDVRSVCKPPIKLESDREALVELIAEGLSWVMAGLDDAPHQDGNKNVHEGCCACGAYTAPLQLPLYAHALDRLLKTSRGVSTFVSFTSWTARNLHDLPVASRRYTLVRKPNKIPGVYCIGDWMVEPFWAGRTIDWSFEDEKKGG